MKGLMTKRTKKAAKRPKNGSVKGRIHTKSGIKETDILIQCRLPVKAAKALSAKAKAAKASRASLVRGILIKAA